MLKIGLTGNYYSGQNEVSKSFENIGVKVFDADLLLKYLINYSRPHMEKVKESFGESSYNMGLLNFAKFKSNKNWNDLIDLLEFDIIKSYERFRLNHKDDLYTVFKYSFLFERRLNDSMDSVINCYRPKYLRRNDMKSLTYMDIYKIDFVLDNEMNEIFKNKKSTYVINNYIQSDLNEEKSYINLDSKVQKINNSIQNKNPQGLDLGTKEYISGFWD